VLASARQRSDQAVKCDREFAHADIEGIIEQGIRDREFPAQDVQASAACIVGSLFDGLVDPLALDSLSPAERQRQANAIVAFCVRGTSGKNELNSAEPGCSNPEIRPHVQSDAPPSRA
jgi:hypothetical protein